MTAGELIAQVDELRPNAYSQAQKLRWLRRLDGQILCEIEESHGGCLPPAGGRRPGEARPDEGSSPSEPAGEEPLSPQETRPSALLTASPRGGEAAVLPLTYDTDTELLAPFPWDEGLYTAWLFCQIDLHNGEIQKYNQSLQLLAAAWRSLADRVNRGSAPRGVPTWRM
jgi:hypothetical protein